jgi:hypothetical protein
LEEETIGLRLLKNSRPVDFPEPEGESILVVVGFGPKGGDRRGREKSDLVQGAL